MEKYHSRVSCISRRKRTDKQGGKVIGITEAGILLPQMLGQDIVVQGNPRVYKALRDELANVS